MDTFKKVQVTQEGYDTLKKELEELTSIKRPKVVARLERARNEGDLSENADYSSAKEELEFLDGRIDELKYVVDNADIIKAKKAGGNQVNVGTKVTLQANGDEHNFEIVGEWEADPINRKISHESPLGKALIGKAVGETVEVEAPAGKIAYEILSIS